MAKTGRRIRLSDGGLKAFAIAREVRTLWSVTTTPKQIDGGPLLCQSVELRSLVVAAVFGRNNRNGTLTIVDPRTGKEVVLP